MMRLLIISASYGSCSSGGVDCSRRSGRELTFKEVASSIPHVVRTTEELIDNGGPGVVLLMEFLILC